MTPTLPQLIAELKAVEAKATRGPVKVVQHSAQAVALSSPNLDRLCVFHQTGRRRMSEVLDDANHAALSRNILPHLIAVVEKQAEEIGQLMELATKGKQNTPAWNAWSEACKARLEATQSLLAAWQGAKEKA